MIYYEVLMEAENKFKTGLIEGFYGAPWSWVERNDMIDFLSGNGYSYYIYAPKADRKLREDWHLEWNSKEFEEVSAFREKCRDKGIEFGIGLSPFELYFNWNDEGKDLLRKKIADINKLEPEILWILFDDMQGDRDNMASIQVEITHFIKSLSCSKKVAMCPTYYSFDPVLKALFGYMPTNYLDDLGNQLDKDVDIIWSGPVVCSKEITADHLKEVSGILKRKPLLWDNYPVNDSPRLTPFLHLDGFKNRTREIKKICSGHTINPMVQPYLSQLPLATLSDFYLDDSYDVSKSTEKHGKRLFGDDLWDVLKDDIDSFENRGVGSGKHPEVLDTWTDAIEGAKYFDLLNEVEKSKLIQDRKEFNRVMANSLTVNEIKGLIAKYEAFTCKYSKEVIDWLKGKYSFDPEILNN